MDGCYLHSQCAMHLISKFYYMLWYFSGNRLSFFIFIFHHEYITGKMLGLNTTVLRCRAWGCECTHVHTTTPLGFAPPGSYTSTLPEGHIFFPNSCDLNQVSKLSSSGDPAPDVKKMWKCIRMRPVL